MAYVNEICLNLHKKFVSFQVRITAFHLQAWYVCSRPVYTVYQFTREYENRSVSYNCICEMPAVVTSNAQHLPELPYLINASFDKYLFLRLSTSHTVKRILALQEKFGKKHA